MIGSVIFHTTLGDQDTTFSTFFKLQSRFDKLEREIRVPKAEISNLVTDLIVLLKQLDLENWTCKAVKGLYFYYHKNNMKGIDPATVSPNICKK
jgi:hypothetical protein